jgi:hypothetical protein
MAEPATIGEGTHVNIKLVWGLLAAAIAAGLWSGGASVSLEHRLTTVETKIEVQGGYVAATLAELRAELGARAQR